MPRSDHGDERSQNFYAQFMRATAQDNGEAIQELIVRTRTAGQLDENLLRLALQNAAKKGNAKSARVLLENGARTDLTGNKGSPALFWAVSQPQNRGHIQVTKLLLHGEYEGCPADMEWQDETGSTIFMSAAFRGNKEPLKLLLDSGANVNARDRNGMTILHLLAADKKTNTERRFKWDKDTVALILGKPIDLDVRDNRFRTALHWAAATGKKELVEQLLMNRQYSRASINMRTSRGKTALHLACDAMPPDPDVVKVLIRHGADPSMRSDGGFTCLHNSASVQSSPEIVNILLDQSPHLLNAQTSPGLTALHFAAQAGSLEVVDCLLQRAETKINEKDSFYSTPLLRAAQFGHVNVVNRLAPFNNISRQSTYASYACQAFSATVVDFRFGGDHQNMTRNRVQNLVQKYSVHEVLYGLDKDNDHLVPTQVQNIKSGSRTNQRTSGSGDSRPRFRWIHLPANNLAWVEALLSKSFIESGASDIDGFKAVEKGFSQQHRGSKFHSHFMRAHCQRSARGTDSGETLPSYTAAESARRDSALQVPGRADITSSPERTGRRTIPRPYNRGNNHQQGRTFAPVSEQAEGGADEGTSLVQTPEMMTSRSNTGAESSVPRTPRVTEAPPATDGNSPQQEAPNSGSRRTRTRRRRRNAPNSGTDPAAAEPADLGDDPQLPRRTSFAVSEVSVRSTGSNRNQRSNVAGNADSGSNITFFMPYLHFETDKGRRKMRDAVRRAEAHVAGAAQKPVSDDEALVWAHLHSTTGLHLRRTLDQFYLHGIDTENRDSDQVVGRFFRERRKEEKIFMVDQLWLWILGPGLIVTSFPQRWEQPKNDPLNVLDGVIEDLNSKTRPQVQSVYDLALLITARCCGSFDRHRPGDEDYQFLDMFESSIGKVSDQETTLYSDFYAASKAVQKWLSPGQPSSKILTSYKGTYDRYPDVVDHFINIGKETALLKEIKDIRDELNMISMVLNQQKSTLPALCDAVCDDLTKVANHSKVRESKRKMEEQKKIVTVHLEELARMGKLAGSIEESLLNLLDLKQKQSNALEARFARDQAAGTVRQGQIIMVFTMVTIIFLPLSFMAAFFAINIKEFPHDANGNQELHLGYVTKYTLGIGLGISLLLIAVAFSLNALSDFWQSAREAFAKRRAARHPPEPSTLSATSKVAEVYGLTRFSQEGYRRSIETNRSIDIGALPRTYTGHSEASRRHGYSHDMERGVTTK